MNIDNIRKLALEKKEKLKLSGENLEKIDLIICFLSDDLCFFKVDINLSIPILLYLGISKETVKDIYFQLISSNNYKKEYEVRTIIEKISL